MPYPDQTPPLHRNTSHSYQIEQALALLSEPEFQRFANAMPNMVWTAKPSGEIDFVNLATTLCTGLETDYALKDWIQIVHPEDARETLACWFESVQAGRPFSITYRLRHLGHGSYRWHVTKAIPIRISSGDIVKWYGTSTDIHENKLTTEENTRLALRISATLESITDAFIAFDRHWRITYLNRETERLMQRPRGDLLHKIVWDEYPQLVNTILFQQFHDAMAEQRPVEFECLGPVTNRWFSLRAFPSPEGLNVYFRDITEHRRLRSFKAEQSKLLERMAAGASLAEVLATVARITESEDPTTICSVMLTDKECRRLYQAFAPHLPEDFSQAVDGIDIAWGVGSCGTAAATVQPVIVSDIASDPLWIDYRKLALQHGLRACWSQPILSGTGRLLGTFAIYSRVARSPSPTEVEILELSAHILSIGMERQRAQEESIRIHRALKMLSRCNQAIAAVSNEQELLDTLCRLVTDTGGYKAAWIGLVEEHRQAVVPVAWAGDDGDVAYIASLNLSYAEASPTGQGPAARTVRNGKPTVASADDAIFSPWREAATRRGYRSGICLPLRSKSRTFGILVLYSTEASTVEAEEMQLLEELANNVAFSMESQRAKEQHRRMEAAIEQIAASVSADAGDQFFEYLVHSLTVALGAQVGVLARLLPDRPGFASSVAVVIDGQVCENFTYAIDGSPCAQFIAEHGLVFQDHLAERFPQAPFLVEVGARAGVGRRLVNATGEVIGILFALFREPIKEHALMQPTLQIFVARAAGELQRQQTEQEIRCSKNELRRLYDLLQTTREEERRSLSREVHDQLGQILSAAKIDISLLEQDFARAEGMLSRQEAGEELRSARLAIEKAIQVVRQLATDLRPPELETQGLPAAITWHAQDFERRTRIRCRLKLQAGLEEMEDQVAVSLFRIFQEAMTNVLRHAQATEVSISLACYGSWIRLRVADNGIGIKRAIARAGHSNGIKGMRERAALAGGILLVGSPGRCGTLVSVRVPMAAYHSCISDDNP